MEDYYKILELTPQASAEEISKAIAAHYNQIRRLVNHHDPNIVNQANSALQVLEQMKVILLDPQKKADYDLQFNKIGGLADTSVITSVPGGGIPGIGNIHKNQTGGDIQYPDGSSCPKCQRSNPKGAMFCQYCAEPISRICPNCQTKYEIKVPFCPSCGKSVEQAKQKTALAIELQNKQIRKRNISQKSFESAFPDSRYMDFISVGSFGWSIFMGFTFAVNFLYSLIFAIFFRILNSGSYGTLRVIYGVFTFLDWVIWAGVLALFYYLIKQKGMKISIPALGGYAAVSLLVMISRSSLGSFSSWWLFMAIVSIGLIIFSGYVFSKDAVAIPAPEINLPVYKKFESLVIKIFAQYDKSVWTVVGIGAGAELLAVILSYSSGYIAVLFSELISVAVAGLLMVVALRSNQTLENQKVRFTALQRSETHEVTKLDEEIANLQKQIKDLG